MSSATRQATNRENAQHSTGPRTPQGKATVSQNANRHNLTGRLLLREDEREPFEGFEATLRAQLAPTGALEITLFEQLISSGWNLRRVETLEAETFAHGPLADENIARQLDRLSRYRGQHERSFYRALHELQTLQTGREILDRLAQPQKTTYTPLADLHKVKRVGFVLSPSLKAPDSAFDWLKAAFEPPPSHAPQTT